MTEQHEYWDPFLAVLLAFAWQIVPATIWGFTHAGEPQDPAGYVLLLVIVPAIAAFHRLLFVDRDVQLYGRAVTLFITTAAVGALALLIIWGGLYVILWVSLTLAGPHW